MQVARILWSCLTIVGVPAIGTFVCAAEPQVVVHVASGRQFEGVIDGTSGNEQLVLRMEHTGITIRRPIRWERVTGASVDGQPVEVATLRARVQGSGFRVQESGISGQKLSPRKIEMRGNTSSPPATDETNPVELPRVTMVTFDAAVANWDADVETDGLLIDVVPLDIDRRLVPVSGTLEVELYAPQRRTLDLAPQSGGATIELVERWTRAITPDDFGPSGVRLRLPFGAITPELQPNWTAWHYGLVHVRLAVPGHGVFEDSRDGVGIRPFSPLRDRLEMWTGQRFLSTETLGRRD